MMEKRDGEGGTEKDKWKAMHAGRERGMAPVEKTNTYESAHQLLASSGALFTNGPSASHTHNTPKSAENRLLL